MAMNRRGITLNDANVVKHRCCLYKIRVESQFWMIPADKQCPIGHLPTMHKEDVPQGIILLVKMIDNGLIIHTQLIFRTLYPSQILAFLHLGTLLG